MDADPPLRGFIARVLSARSDWRLPSAGILALALVYAAFSRIAWRYHPTTVYPAAIMYSLSAVWLLALTGLLFIVLLFSWRGRKFRREQAGTSGISVWCLGLALPAFLFAWLPTALSRLHHSDSARFGGHVYYLAERSKWDGENHYLLYECGQYGILCASSLVCRFSGHKKPERPARLTKDKGARTLSVVIGTEVIYTLGAEFPGYSQRPQCFLP